MKRHEALKSLAGILTEEDLVVTSIGGVKPEWFALMPGDGTMFTDLLGCATPLALLGVALALPHRRVLAFDSDGSILFNPGALCTVANELPPNLTIIVFDNEQYESVGGHRTHTSRNVNLERLAAGAGIARTATAQDLESFVQATTMMLSDQQVGLLVAKVEPGRFTEFPAERVKQSDGLEDEYRFIRHIERVEHISIRPRYVRE
jgi:sulfopyruvate decarboxylase subunit beta